VRLNLFEYLVIAHVSGLRSSVANRALHPSIKVSSLVKPSLTPVPLSLIIAGHPSGTVIDARLDFDLRHPLGRIDSLFRLHLRKFNRPAQTKERKLGYKFIK